MKFEITYQDQDQVTVTDETGRVIEAEISARYNDVCTDRGDYFTPPEYELLERFDLIDWNVTNDKPSLNKAEAMQLECFLESNVQYWEDDTLEADEPDPDYYRDRVLLGL